MNVILSDSIGVRSTNNVFMDAHDDKYYNLRQKHLQFSQTHLKIGKNQTCPNTFDSTFLIFL